MDKIVKIPLRHGLFTTVNHEDFERIKHINWYAAKNQSTGKWYVRGYDKSRYVPVRRIQKPIWLHRYILGVTDPNILVDHKNHNTLDNTRVNLRPCSKAENNRNCSGARRGSSSRYLGVFKRVFKTCTKWRSGVNVSGKMYWLGHFDTEEKAALAYNEAAKKHFGEFASLNVIS